MHVLMILVSHMFVFIEVMAKVYIVEAVTFVCSENGGYR